MEKDRAEKIREFILNHVEEYSSDIVNMAMKEFSVTRTTIHRHINTLIKNDKLVKIGKTQSAQYFLKDAINKKFTYDIKEGLAENEVWDDQLSEPFKNLKENVNSICHYGFTEMYNNSIDHSDGSKITVITKREEDGVQIDIIDNGVGIFKKIKDYFKLEDIRDAVFQLTKGKLTTDPDNHTGEGIFFSSRAFDEFRIYANGILYARDNTEDDWYLEDRDDTTKKGTLFRMKIAETSSRKLEEIFEQYQNKDTMAFDKTHIIVQFSRFGDERFVSRSQAKRVLKGIEKFKYVTLDFKGVEGLGQGFVDEVFRVFPKKNSQIEFDYINANKSVEKMIERSKATTELSDSIEQPRSK